MPWLLLALVVIAVAVALVLRIVSSRRAKATAVRNRALGAYLEGMALHDELAVVAMGEHADRAAAFEDALAIIDRLGPEFDALAAESTLSAASAQIDRVRLELANLADAIRAQPSPQPVDSDLLRVRLMDLETALKGFHLWLEPGPSGFEEPPPEVTTKPTG